MFIVEKTLISALIAINVILIVVIFSSLVKDNQPAEGIAVTTAPEKQATEPARTIITTDTDITAKTPTPAPVTRATNQKTESLAQSIQRVVNSETVVIDRTEPVTEETDTVTNNVEGFYDGNMVRMEERDSEGNRHTTISNLLEDIGKLYKNDSDYIGALNELKRGNIARVPFSTTSQITAKNQPAKVQSSEETVDHFNKVDVSSKKAPPVEAKLTLAQQIEKALADEDNASNTTTNTSEETHTDAYLATLETASKERKNEMRTIKVKRGDTLWVIARRAYGSGFQYPRIYKANPHLTSPDKIEVGDVLRVPL